MKLNVINLELIERLAKCFYEIVCNCFERENIKSKQTSFGLTLNDLNNSSPKFYAQLYSGLARTCFEVIDSFIERNGAEFSTSVLRKEAGFFSFQEHNSFPAMCELTDRLRFKFNKLYCREVEGVKAGEIISKIVIEIGYEETVKLALAIIYDWTDRGLVYEQFIKPYSTENMAFVQVLGAVEGRYEKSFRTDMS